MKLLPLTLIKSATLLTLILSTSLFPSSAASLSDNDANNGKQLRQLRGGGRGGRKQQQQDRSTTSITVKKNKTDELGVQPVPARAAATAQENNDGIDLFTNKIEIAALMDNVVTGENKQERSLNDHHQHVSFIGYHGYACRTTSDSSNGWGNTGNDPIDTTTTSSNGQAGREGYDFNSHYYVSDEWCRNQCKLQGSNCQAYAYETDIEKCEIWFIFYHLYEVQPGTTCYYKKD